MIHEILLPSRPRIVSSTKEKGVFEIDSFYPGYGTTMGNLLRRILLSSLPGSAVTQVRIDGVHHEFSTIEGVTEDVITILLNIKKLRFIMNTDEPQTVELKVKGPGSATGKDITIPSTLSIANPDEHIVTVSGKNKEFHIEMIVERGLGYMPREVSYREKVHVGMITLDALFSPVRKVNYEVENMRVGDRTDYNRLRLTIETDGTLSPADALQQSVQIAVDQCNAITQFADIESSEESSLGIKTNAEAQELADEIVRERQMQEEETDASKVKIEDLRLSSRTINALHEHGIKTVGGLIRRDMDSLGEIPGVGEKAIQEIKRALGSLGLTLK